MPHPSFNGLSTMNGRSNMVSGERFPSSFSLADKSFLELGSDIIHLNIAGSSLVVVDTAEAANELFDKRSSIYSSRYVLIPKYFPSFAEVSFILIASPRFIMLNELSGSVYHIQLSRYSRGI